MASFTDNPVVSQLMQVTGLNDLVASAATPGASPIGAVSSQNAPKSPNYRPEYQQARPPVSPTMAAGPRGSGAGYAVPPPAQQGVMSADTLQSPTVHDLLGYYGVSAPQNIDDHLFIHDPQAFAKHPMVSGMIERGLGGLANYHTGHDTAETLSNIASSVLGNDAMHQQAYNARAMAPLAQAQQVGALMENKQRMEQQAAQAQFEAAHQKWYEGQFDNAQQLTQSRQDLMGAQAELARANARNKDNTPAGMFASDYHARLSALGGGDESKVPADQAHKLYMDMLGEQSHQQATGKVDVQKVRNQGMETTQQIRNQGKAGRGSFDAGDRATDTGLRNDLNTAQKEYGALQKYMNADANGKLALIGKDPATYGVGDDVIQKRMDELVTKAQGIHGKRAKLYAGKGMHYGVDTDAAPAAQAPGVAPVAGNPYRTQTPQQ